MNTKLVRGNVAVMMIFLAIGMTMFTENVRLVQIIGLFACGAVFGVFLAGIISAIRKKDTNA